MYFSLVCFLKIGYLFKQKSKPVFLCFKIKLNSILDKNSKLLM